MMTAMERDDVHRWVASYERAWRTAGVDLLPELFAEDATYLMSPWARPARGLEAIGELWESERDGPDEVFTLRTDVVAVDGATAVVRAEVHYAASGTDWRDLWVLRFDQRGRCAAFEEWPFAPDQPDGHG